jgi:hypothetical protein
METCPSQIGAVMKSFPFVESWIDTQSSSTVRPNTQFNLVQRPSLWLAGCNTLPGTACQEELARVGPTAFPVTSRRVS